MSCFVLAELQRSLELHILLEDCLGLDHPLEHAVRLSLELAILARGMPIVAGTGDHAFGRRRHFMKKAAEPVR